MEAVRVGRILWILPTWCSGPEMIQSHVLRNMLTRFYAEQLAEKETTAYSQ